jgi:hypothetical protein
MINRQPLSEQLRLDPGRARFLMEPIFDPRVIQTDPELRRFLQYLRTDTSTKLFIRISNLLILYSVL